MTPIRPFCPKIRAILSNFWKRAGDGSPPPPPSSYAPVLNIHKSRAFNVNAAQ